MVDDNQYVDVYSFNTNDNSGATKRVVLNVSWYSDWSKDDNGKKRVFVSNNRSFIVLLNKWSLKFLDELLFNKIMSRWDVLDMESIVMCWLIKEDWNTKETNDQSDATKVEVFSQFKASDNHAWSVDL